MPPKAQNTGNKKPVGSDARFDKLKTDSRFRVQKKKTEKVKLDPRFSAIRNDDAFKVKKLDKFGREIDENEQDIAKIYTLDNDNDDEEQHDDDKSSINTTKPSDNDSEDDTLPHDDVLSDESTDIGSTDDDYDDDLSDDEQDIIPEGYTQGSIPGSYAPIVTDVSKRLALYNMDWEQLKAVDILAVMRFFCPPGGSISRCSVYPSQFGREMMAREKRGDFTLWSDPQYDLLVEKAREQRNNGKNDNKKGNKKDNKKNQQNKKNQKNDSDDDDIEDYNDLSDSEIDRLMFQDHDENTMTPAQRQEQQKRLLDYELGKLRYYYAILECDSISTAEHIYKEADGLEYESSGNLFDLRFVPDGHIFEENTLRDRADTVPPNHRPPRYTTQCLESSNVECTWERNDPVRDRLLRQAYDQANYQVDDLTAFLDNTSDEEGFATDVPVSETDSDDDGNSSGINDDDNDDSDDDSSINHKKNKGDSIGAELLRGTKVVDGKTKKIYALKRRARNEFLDVLNSLDDEQTAKDKAEKQKDKLSLLKKANKALNKDDNNDNTSDSDDDSDNDMAFTGKETLSDHNKRQTKKNIITFTNLLTAANDDDDDDSDNNSDDDTTTTSTSKTNKKDTLSSKKKKSQEINEILEGMKMQSMNIKVDNIHTKIAPVSTDDAAKARQQRLALWQSSLPSATPAGPATTTKPTTDSKTSKQVKEQTKSSIKESTTVTTASSKKDKDTKSNDTKKKDDNKKDTKKTDTKKKDIPSPPAAGSRLFADDSSDDDNIDYDDDFYKDAFNEEEFGHVDLSKEQKNKKSNSMNDSDNDVPSKTKTQNNTGGKDKKSTTAAITNDDDSSDDDNHGYNLTDLVKRHKTVELARTMKRKRGKDIENELINETLGIDTHHTIDNTLTQHDLNKASRILNKGQNTKRLKTVNIKNIHDNISNIDNDNSNNTDTFTLNIKDDRFTDVFNDPDFAIDTTNPSYHATSGTDQIIKESQRIRKTKVQQQEEMIKARKSGTAPTITSTTSSAKSTSNKGGLSDDLAQLVGQVKTNTKMNQVKKANSRSK